MDPGGTHRKHCNLFLGYFVDILITRVENCSLDMPDMGAFHSLARTRSVRTSLYNTAKRSDLQSVTGKQKRPLARFSSTEKYTATVVIGMRYKSPVDGVDVVGVIATSAAKDIGDVGRRE